MSIKNYWKIAWRNMIRQKAFTLIHVAGLALSLCTCLVIWQVIRFEFNFDDFHPDKQRIYRLINNAHYSNGVTIISDGFPQSAPTFLQREIPGIETVASYYPYWASIDIPGSFKKTGTDHQFSSVLPGVDRNTGTMITDGNYFGIFLYDWLAGNPSAALSAPFSVVLTESRANTYFGNLPLNSMVGRELIYNDSIMVRVTGIVKDWKGNTDFPYSDFISMSTIDGNRFLKRWLYGTGQTPVRSIRTFEKLMPGASVSRINGQLVGFMNRHPGSDQSQKSSVYLQPLNDIHFDTQSQDNFRKASLSSLYILGTIAIFILIIAIVNFINLSTAQSIQRSKYIGIRKILGSSRQGLVAQFLIETFLHVLPASVIAVLLAQPVMTAFHDFMPPGLQFHVEDPTSVLSLLLVVLCISLLAGIYPARVISSYQPVVGIRDQFKGSNKWWLRKGLIIFQFTISLVLIIGTIVINRQLTFVRYKDLGLTADAVINLTAPPRDSIKIVLAQKIRQMAGVSMVAHEILPPVGAPSFFMSLTYKGKNEAQINAVARGGDDNLIPLYQMRLLAGRNLQHSDSTEELVINQTFANAMGFVHAEDAIGKLLYTDTSSKAPAAVRKRILPIVGVIADVYEYSLHEAIKPMVIAHIPALESRLAVKLDTRRGQLADVKTILSNIEKVWKEVYLGKPFNYAFLDESIVAMYENDRRTATLMNTATVITIVISCMGLFGLALFTAEKRTKEIGIRKVLGAGVPNLVALFSRDFLVLVLLASLIASPIAWYLMNKWMQNFVYHASISWWIFLFAGLGAALIVLVTISFQTIRAALANPINSLRMEG